MAEKVKSLSDYLLSKLATWDADEEHVEIEGHRIENVIPGVIQYNYLPKDGEGWIRGFGVHCKEEHIEEVTRKLRQFPLKWAEPRNSKLLLPDSTPKTTTQVLLTSTIPSNEPDQTARVGNWVYRPEAILERLENDSTPEKDRLAAVLFAETKPFDGELRPRLLSALGIFIESNRLTEDSDRMIYLCSAIRKYAMNMGQDQIENYVEWLLPTDTTPVHHEVEMEFIKGLSYRLQFEKLSLPQEFPKSLAILSDIAFGYLRKSLVLQKSYANTAMLVIVCVSILESMFSTTSDLTTELLKKVNSLGISWFHEMVEDNLTEALQFVEENNPEVAENLHSLLGEM